MRETLWLKLRRSSLLRKLYAIRIFTFPMKWLSFHLVPSRGTRSLRVRSGPGKGLKFELNPRWETSAWEGNYERLVQEYLLKQLKSGGVFYDVGANFGFYSLLAARLGAQVFAFEPDDHNANSLKQHARANSLDAKIEIICKAVYSFSGSISLEPAITERGHGNAHVGGGIVESASPAVQVPCTTLDDFAERHPVPTLVKIDVEGAESDVLRGAEELFTLSRPHLLCEVHDPVNASFVAAWLSARGYAIHWLDQSDKLPTQLFAAPK